MNYVKGETHFNHKLTEEKVINIRKKYAGGATLAQLADEFNVARQTIHKIVQRIRWVHVD